MKQPMRWHTRWCNWSIATLNARFLFFYIPYKYVDIDADIECMGSLSHFSENCLPNYLLSIDSQIYEDL